MVVIKHDRRIIKDKLEESTGQRPIVLILTATINPPVNCPALLRSDPAVRLNDYCEALKYYLSLSSKSINRIIFVENSDSNLETLMNIEKHTKHNKLVEFIPFLGGNNFPPKYGKGYGEMLMLNYALDNSKIISGNELFWKATGRLILLNIESLIQNAPKSYDIYCDLHDSFRAIGLEFFFDPRFYSFTMKGYNKYLRLEADKLRYAHIEHLFYHIIKNGVHTGEIAPRFRDQPFISGYNGATNKYYFTRKKKIQRYAQQFMRYAAPWLWL